MGALLLDEDPFQTCTSATVGDHDLFRVIEHLGVVHAARPRVLLFTVLVQVLHLVGHEGLPLLVDALGAFTALLVDVGSLD